MKLFQMALGMGLLTTTVFAGSPLEIKFGNFLPKVIYGEDNRKDLYEAQAPAYAILAGSTAALFQNSSVTATSDGSYSLKTAKYGTQMNLCTDEPFYDQPIGAFCSGSLVGPDLMMTAGHCIRSQSSCESTTFVFNYAVQRSGQYPSRAAANDVYRCKSIIQRMEVGTGADYALVKVDRVVSGHSPLQINRSGTIEEGTPLVVIGHPSGLPTKISDGAIVRDADRDGYFIANLDTYGGNSGSAVFNTMTGLVEGILVRGEQDFTYRGGCAVSNRCADGACRGEDVTKISALSEFIP